MRKVKITDSAKARKMFLGVERRDISNSVGLKRKKSNAWHHAPPRKIDIDERQCVGGRVHALVGVLQDYLLRILIDSIRSSGMIITPSSVYIPQYEFEDAITPPSS
jgi:hypothetical protein